MAEMLELAYHISGILAGIFLAGIVVLLFKKNKDIVRTNIFLKYTNFRASFAIFAIGSVILIIGNIIGLVLHERFEILHDYGEIVYNISVFIFALLIFKIIRGEKWLTQKKTS